MRWFILFMGCLFPLMALSGCLDGLGGSSASAEPKTHEFTLVVPASTSGTIELYEKNDGSQMRVVAIAFETPDQEGPKVPNPEIRVKEGDTVIVRVINNNPLDHTFHLHGGLVPWQEDGADFLSQMPIMQGQEYTYTFTDLKAGTYWYHCTWMGPTTSTSGCTALSSSRSATRRFLTIGTTSSCWTRPTPATCTATRTL